MGLRRECKLGMRLGNRRRGPTHRHSPDGICANGLGQSLQHRGDPTQEEDEEYSRLHVVGQEIWRVRVKINEPSIGVIGSAVTKRV